MVLTPEQRAEMRAYRCRCPRCTPGGTAHHWTWFMSNAEGATCWCQPFRAGGGYACIEQDGTISLGVMHRPTDKPYGYVYWEFGEQGPLSPDCSILEEPVFEDLDR